MNKIAFLYPGQGSQKVGMGKDLLDKYPPAREIFKEAEQILGFDLKRICLQGPEEELTQTLKLQPALFTISWIITKFLREKNILPEAVAGHSLGEYSAILAAGVFNFTTGLKIVKERARLMEEAAREKKGTMAAVIGLDKDEVVEICSQMGEVQAVNFNCPGQVVISGDFKKMPVVVEQLKKKGAKKVVFLPVSGAFHSHLMKSAARKFSSFLDQFCFENPLCKVVSNATGDYADSAQKLKDNLKLQMDHPVLWEKSMRLLLNDGFNLFVEVGPGKVLQGLMRKINKKVSILGVESIESVNKLIPLILGGSGLEF